MKILSSFFLKSIVFLKRQQKDWNVTVIRTSISRLAYQAIFPYLSIYIVALGATATQLGIINSIGMLVAAIISPLTGWFIDRTGPKNIYLLGIGLLAISYLTYGIAHSWFLTIIAMTTYWMGFSVSIHSCATICGNCLANEDRATGMTVCETVASGILGMAGPMLGAWIVTASGGANVDGIRPIFYFCLILTVITFIIVLMKLSNKKLVRARVSSHSMFRDLFQVMKEGHHLKKWILISSIVQFPLAMVFPFSQLYAYQIKGATPFVLGAMVTGSALASIVFAIPLGSLADKIGRKKILYVTAPLFWVSNLLLVWSPSPLFLVIAGALQGFYYIGGPISAAMERELVPPEQMGRWVGIARFFRMLLNACLAFVCGIIWDKMGPQYVFLIFVGIDVVIRMPLLINMPETLRMRLGKQIS
ncbi:MAG: MFS transporter [Dehalococcoidales bacterium]|nr:MFS transporter [Dehalococcoidales bacterium]